MTEVRLRRRTSPVTRPTNTIDQKKQYPSSVTPREKESLDIQKGYVWLLRIFIIIHVLACLFYAVGIYWRLSFHTGEECEMTYSYPNFVPLKVPRKNPLSKLSQNYELYKFIDSRDPRYQDLLSKSSEPIEDTTRHCGGVNQVGNSTVVLFIPGHWGSYTQARSLGAHGTQWTRSQQSDSRMAIRSLRNGEWSGRASRLDQFVYEVYTVDFTEQGGALHGRFLEEQSNFVAQVVEQLSNQCQVDEIFLVAHSMGGYVARLTVKRYPHLQSILKNIITLATPHSNPLYAFDGSIHTLHTKGLIQHMNETVQQSLWVSLSGGLRDEMIAPMACEMVGGYSYLTNTLMSSGTFGMDHRAIVWCHGILERVRELIWELMRANSGTSSADDVTITVTTTTVVERVLGITAYKKDMMELESRAVSHFGVMRTFAMECTMLYNLPVVFGLHAILASLHCASLFCMPLVIVFFIMSDLPLGMLVFLTLIANSIHFLTIKVLSWKAPNIQAPTTTRRYSRRTLVLVTAIIGVVLVSSAMLVLQSKRWSISDSIQAIVFIGGILFIYLASCSWLIPPLASLVVLTTPGIFAGTIVLMGWEQSIEHRSWWMWIRFVWPIIAVTYFAQTMKSSTPTRKNRRHPPEGTVHFLRSVLMIAVVFWKGLGILMRGNAYQVGHLVESILILEVVTSWVMHFLDRGL